MNKTFAFLGLSFVCLPGVPAIAATIQIQNQSSWDTHEIYFAPSSHDDWGDDHLGKQVLKSGMTLSLSDVEPGLWGVRLVDDDEDECVVGAQQISASQTFVIDNEDLLNCQANSEQ